MWTGTFVFQRSVIYPVFSFKSDTALLLYQFSHIEYYSLLISVLSGDDESSKNGIKTASIFIQAGIFNPGMCWFWLILVVSFHNM